MTVPMNRSADLPDHAPRHAGLRIAPLCAALLLALSAGLPARAGIFDDDEARKAIIDLRTQVNRLTLEQQNQQSRQNQMNDQLASHQTAIDQIKRSLLELNEQIEQLRADIAKLRGQDEQSGFQTRQVSLDLSRLRDQYTALDERLRKLEPQKVSVDGREAVVDPEERRAYDGAMATLRQGDFNVAANSLQSFLKRYPNSVYKGQTLYWLGQSLYGKGDVKEAQAAFRDLIAGFPQHPQLPEAMLALANCQIELKDNKAARKTLDDLVKAYPQSEAAKAGRDRLAKLK